MNLCTDVWSPLAVAPKCIPDQNVRSVVGWWCIYSILVLYISQINTARSNDALREILMEEEVLACISEAGFTKPLFSVTLKKLYSVHRYYIPPIRKGI